MDPWRSFRSARRRRDAHVIVPPHLQGVVNEQEIMASVSLRSLSSPFPSIFWWDLRGPTERQGAPAVPTWGEQYPKMILVCLPEALSDRWFLKSPGFLPA